MKKFLFRYIINNPKSDLWLGKNNKWVSQNAALHFGSIKAAQNKCNKLDMDLQIWEVPYERGLPRQHWIYKSSTYLKNYSPVSVMLPTFPSYPSLMNMVF